MPERDNAERAESGLLLLVDSTSDAEAALRSTAAHLAHLCDRAGLLFDERLAEALARHAEDVRAGGLAPRGPLEIRAWRPPLRLAAGGPNDRRAWLAEDALAGVSPGSAPIAGRVTEALRDLAHCADRLGERPEVVLGPAAGGLYREHRREGAPAPRDRERFPAEDPAIVALARRVAELDATSDTLESAPVAAWEWATPGCTLWRAEPFFAERNLLAPGELLPERPAGEADQLGSDADGRAVALRGWRIGAGGEPRLLLEWLRWPAGPGVRETAHLAHAHLHWAGRERDDADGRLVERWQLSDARNWSRERYGYDTEGRVVRISELQATPAHPIRETEFAVEYGADGRLERIDRTSDGATTTVFPP